MIIESYLNYLYGDKKIVSEIEPVTGTLMLAAYGMSAFYAAINGYNKFLTSAAKSCAGIADTSLKEKCMVKYKIEANRKLANDLRGSRGKCKGDEKCLDKFEKKIKKCEDKVGKYQLQYRRMFKR